MADCPGVIEATTYGVEIPGADGRAGMAAIVIDDNFDIAEFASHLAQRLPVYACPVMIRICTALDTTETFKQKKHELVREGFDPHQVTDPLFFREPKSGEYRPIDADAPMRASSMARSGCKAVRCFLAIANSGGKRRASVYQCEAKSSPQAGDISHFRSMMSSHNLTRRRNNPCR